MIAPAADKTPAPGLTLTVEPLLVGVEAAGRVCGVSGRTWRRLVAAGATPAPIRLGTRNLWSVAELAGWVDAGCPGRVRWQRRKEIAHAI